MERISQLKAFLTGNPGDPFIKHALALEYIKTGDDSAAQQLFEDILSGNPAYVGSYYHLAKLLERNGDIGMAADWYEKGMQAAREAGDHHALNELRIAYEELVD